MKPDFTIIQTEQRTPEWYRARAGRLTGSMAHIIFVKARTGAKESVQRRDYRLQLAAERVAGEAQESHFFTAEMQRGIYLEPKAFAHYEAATGEVVRRTGFLSHNTHMAGCSLDGDVGDFSGIIELKCPKIATHLKYIKDSSELVSEYMAQVRHNLWITGAAFCDLISFDDRVPARKQMARVRIERYDAKIQEYELAALEFLSEVSREVDAINA